jgi:hypothetical protein
MNEALITLPKRACAEIGELLVVALRQTRGHLGSDSPYGCRRGPREAVTFSWIRTTSMHGHLGRTAFMWAAEGVTWMW